MQIMIRRKGFGVRKFAIVINNENAIVFNIFGLLLAISKKGFKFTDYEK